MLKSRIILSLTAALPLLAHAVSTKEFTDVTGTIKIRVKTCDYVTSTRPNSSSLYTATATCGVDAGSGYVLVGGGAQIEGSPNPGALLKGSRPDPTVGLFGLTQWIAHSSQYAVSNQTHRLRAYSIALSLVGMSAGDLATNVFVNDNTSTVQSNPTITANPLNAGTIMLGGGAIIQPLTANLYMTESRPDGDGWKATFRNDQGSNATGGAKSHVIAIKSCPTWPSGLRWGCLDFSFLSVTGASASGYTFAVVNEAPNGNGNTFWMMTGAGVTAFIDVSARRFVTDIIPLHILNGNQVQGVTTWSKNTAVSGSGHNTVYLRDIRKLP